MQGRVARLLPKATSRRSRLSRIEGGLGTGLGLTSKLDPHRPPDRAPQLKKLDHGHRNDKSGCGEEEPKGRSRRGEYTTGEDRDYLRRRQPPRTTARS